MPNVQLNRVAGIDQETLQILQLNNFATAKEVILCSVTDLIELLNITQTQAVKLQQVVSAHTCPAGVSALHLRLSNSAVLPTSLPTLDSCMRRGIPAGSITELVGPAGVGKSQMCFQLSLLAAAPAACGGLEGAVIYIDTERKFSSTRFAEMARMRFPQHLSSGPALEATMSRVMLISPTSTDELLNCLGMLEAGIIQHKANLVIVDSIASLARADPLSAGSGAMDTSTSSSSHDARNRTVDRQEMLGKVATKLKYLAESFRIPMVVTNQVTTSISRQSTHAFQQQKQDGSGHLTAALGVKWAHCVNVRLVLERLSDKRYLKVAKSAAIANVALEYVVSQKGVEEVLGAVIPEQLNTRDVLSMAIANEVEYESMGV